MEELVVKLPNGPILELNLIAPGTFIMGSGPGEDGRYNNEDPAHEVRILSPFWMGKYPITQAQWQAVMGFNPSRFKGDQLPVEQISWTDAHDFAKRLQELTGYAFRLPNEAEWEYACRAGGMTAYFFGNDPDVLGEFAWYEDNADGATHPVGQKQPNLWELFDMHGNVWEWCQDWYHNTYAGAPAEGREWDHLEGVHKVVRGGSWHAKAQACRSAIRNRLSPRDHYYFLGVRMCVSEDGQCASSA